MIEMPHIDRYAAFSDDPAGGNPAGVVLDAAGLSPAQMQLIARRVGYSETAFVTGPLAAAEIAVRYFAPEGEVDFCGHATIATAVAIGERIGVGTYTLATRVGPVDIAVRAQGDRTSPSCTVHRSTASRCPQSCWRHCWSAWAGRRGISIPTSRPRSVSAGTGIQSWWCGIRHDWQHSPMTSPPCNDSVVNSPGSRCSWWLPTARAGGALATRSRGAGWWRTRPPAPPRPPSPDTCAHEVPPPPATRS